VEVKEGDVVTRIESDVKLVMAHLRAASEAVDRLWNAGHEHQCDAAVLGLGEASLAIHQALLALREWDADANVDGPTALVGVRGRPPAGRPGSRAYVVGAPRPVGT